jgi:hypothetical protein
MLTLQARQIEIQILSRNASQSQFSNGLSKPKSAKIIDKKSVSLIAATRSWQNTNEPWQSTQTDDK